MGGGGKGQMQTQYIPMQTTPTYVAPPQAPAETDAMMELASESAEEIQEKKNAVKNGARSLRIPIGNTNI